MTQYIIDIGAYPDDGQGSPLRTAFDYTNENFNQIFAAGPVLSNIQIGNNTITTTVLNSNLILSPSGIGRVQFNNTLFPRIDNVYDIGTPNLRFNTIYLGNGGVNTVGSITTTGNITASYFFGNGSQLTGIVATTGSQVVNGNSLIDIPAAGSNIFVTVNGTSNVVTFANTGAYVAGQVSATGNISGNYILGNGALLTGINIGYGNSNVANFLPTYTGNLVSLTGPVVTTANITSGNIHTSGQISAVGNIYGGNVNTGRLNAGYITTGTTVSAVGNISTSSYFIGDGSLLTGINANYGNSNVANFLPTYTGNLVSLTGPVVTTANITGGNLQTSGTILASGNITAANLDTGRIIASNIIASGTVSAVANISTGAYFIGDGSQLTNLPAGNYSNANVAAYLPTYTGSLPNLTGLLRTTANIIGNNILIVGNVTSGNVDASRINASNITVSGPVSATGNITGAYFFGDGSQLTNLPSGNYSNANVAAFLPTYTGNLVSLTGPVVTTANITSGNVLTAGQISALGNITGGNIDSNRVNANTVTVSSTISAAGNITGNNLTGAIVTATTVTASGNVIGGNITTVGQISATGNIQGGNLNVSNGTVTSYVVSATGRIQGGNFVTTGYITATGNITGGNVDTGNLHAGNIAVDNIVSAIGNVYGNNFIGRSLTVTGNVSAGNVVASGAFNAASVSTSGNVTGGNLLTTGKVSASGNIAGNYFVGNGSQLTGITVSAGTSLLNGNSNVIVAGNGNVTISSAGVSNVVTFANTGAYIIGEASATGNITGNYIFGNGALLTGISASYSNANVANFLPTYTGNLVSLTGPVITTANITGGNILTGGDVSATGNITGNYFIGNGSQLTGVTASTVDANALTGNTLSSNVLYSSLTSVGVLTGLSVSGGIQVNGNIGANTNLSVTGNATVGNVLTDGIVSAAGNVTGNYILGNGAFLSGVITSVANINNGTSNVTVVSSGGNITVGVGGTGNVAVFATTGEYITGVVSASGNITGGNLVTGGLISSTGNITSTANVTGGNLKTGGLITASGNITAGNVLTGGVISATGNATVGNLSTGGLITAIGNVTGGNLSTAGLITAGGNIQGNNIFATGFASVTGNVIAGNVNTSNIRPTSGELTITTSSGNLNLQPFGNIVLANTFINSVAYPAQDTDAASKLYVDTIASTGITYHTPAYAATTTTLAVATGGTITYTQPNGVSNGVGAYLSTTGSFNLIDSANVQTIGTRILVKNEGNSTYNGVYTWSNATAIVRSTDTNTYGTVPNTLSLNDYFFVTNGNVNAGSAFVVNSPEGVITFGTSNITFALFSQATTYTANVDAGLSLIGTQFNAKVDQNTTAFDGTGNIIVKAGANLTTPNIGAATGTSLSLIGNVQSGNINTGGLISATGNVTGGNVLTTGLISSTGNAIHGNVLTGGVVSATGNVYGNYFVGNIAATTISTAGNIQGGNILTSGLISATGNAIVGNINTAGLITATGNIQGGNVLTTGLISSTGNVTGGNVLTTGLISSTGNITSSANINGGNVLTSGLISATGNATLGNVLTGGVVSATANVIGGNVLTGGLVSATGNIQGSTLIGSVVTASGNITGGNLITAGLITATGNIQGGNVLTGGVVSATGNVTGGNVLTAGLISSTGNITGGNLITSGILSATGNIISVANISGGNILTGGAVSATANITGGNLVTSGLITATGNVTVGNVLTTGQVSATGNITGNYFVGNISQATGGLGNNINMGTNSAGALVSNAVTLTTTTSVTNGIALLNQVLGKLVPPSPSNFPGGTTLSLSGIATYRMANITQVDNTPGANKAVSAGTSVANVLRVATYATNTVANVGPGDSGTITAVRNGSNVGNVTLNTGASPSANGTYGGNLVISNNFDYHSANANITAGFWYVFSAAISGSAAPAGWNELYIADSGASNTNTSVWYYDSSSPSTPSFTSTSMTPPGSANLLYSSTIPHYTNNNNFTIAFNVANVSGNMYPTSNTLASGSSAGAFAAPVTINYNGSNIGSNVLSAFASASANTTASVTTGFGGSATGPSMSVNNSYSTGTLTLTTALANTVLFKSGNTVAVDEGNVVINTTIGTGSGNAYRIVNPGAGNTPTYTGSEAAFNSQSSTLQTYDATVVGSGTSGLLKHDQTNYASGYLPVGPNLSSGRTGTQYFTFKFVRTAVSKFDIKYTGNIAGMWVALPGSVIDSSSSANGWINMAVAYGGAGYPGVNSPGNGSDGCALGGTVSLNTAVTNSSKTCTFGTVSSSSTSTNEIYVRMALTAGQSVTALTLETASN